MRNGWLLAFILVLLCLSISYCFCKTVLISDTRSTPVLERTFRNFLRFAFLKKTLGYLITHYALLSILSPKMEQELGKNGAQKWQWMLMYAQPLPHCHSATQVQLLCF
jgi:hypothetical protein